MRQTRGRLTILVCIGLLFVSLAWLGYGFVNTKLTFSSARQLELETAVANARRALPVARSFNSLTLHKIPELRAWQTSLELVISTPDVVRQITQSFVEPLRNTPETSTKTYIQHLKKLRADLQQSQLLLRLLPNQVPLVKATLDDVILVADNLLTGRHTYLVVFQNTHELRATGGFIGSYALVTLNQGQLESLTIQDIYVPDGQFTGYVPAPPGVQEYLSSGNGLRLPDANWWPDFPASAQQLLAYFALGRESHIEGVVAANLELAETVLAITGDVFVPDYQMTVTADNLADMLRHQRDEFFPGSISKQHLLESTFNQVKFKLAGLNPDQQQQLIAAIDTGVRKKDIQVYSNDPAIQQLFIKYHAAGLISPPPDTAMYVFPVESNVGINKANQGVVRQAQLEVGATSSTLTLQFRNDNPASSAAIIKRPDESPHYANYQRLLLKPEMSVRSISINDQSIAAWKEEFITTSTGEQFKQVGLLVPVPAQSASDIRFTIDHPPLGSNPQLFIPKQAGLPPTLYQVSYQGQTHEIWLHGDTFLKL